MEDLPIRHADSVEEVIAILDDVVDWARREASPLGYFPALYRTVTARVLDGIHTDFFDDGERMARLDVVFANRYLDALSALRDGTDPTRAWALTFDAAASGTPIVLQHLLVGISAHINLDLGVAVADIAPGDRLPGMRRDFDRINQILASMVTASQEHLATISPWLGWLDRLGGRHDDHVVRFSIEIARVQAWRFATELGGLAADARPSAITTRDTGVLPIARTVLRPGRLAPVVWAIGLRESRDVRRNLDVMTAVPGPSLAQVEAEIDTA